MDLKLEDIMTMSLNKLDETLTEEKLELVFGNNILKRKRQEMKMFRVDDASGIERVLIGDVVESLYCLIMMKPEVFISALSSKKIKSPNGVAGYAQNMQSAYEGLLVFEKNLNQAVAQNKEQEYILFRDAKVRKDFAEFMLFFKEIMPVFETGVTIDSISRRTVHSSEEFFREIPAMNEGLRNVLENASKHLARWNDTGVTFIERFYEIKNHFEENSKFVDSKKAEFDKKQEMKKSKSDAQVVSSKQEQPSTEELERRRCIEEANMMFDEFVSGTMRDLERQVPYSVRKECIRLLDKFEKFVNEFSMPLAPSAKLSVAREVCGRLNKLNEYVSNISQNATTTNIYMMKD